MTMNNKLTPDEIERLCRVMAELSIVQKAISDTLINGYSAIAFCEIVNNRTLLTQGVAGLNSAFSVMIGNKDIDVEEIGILLDLKLKDMLDAGSDNIDATNESTLEEIKKSRVLPFVRRLEK